MSWITLSKIMINKMQNLNTKIKTEIYKDMHIRYCPISQVTDTCKHSQVSNNHNSQIWEIIISLYYTLPNHYCSHLSYCPRKHLSPSATSHTNVHHFYPHNKSKSSIVNILIKVTKLEKIIVIYTLHKNDRKRKVIGN